MHNAGAQACKHTCAMTSPLSCALAIMPPAAAAPPTCCMRSCCCSPGCIPDRPPPIPADVCMPCMTFVCKAAPLFSYSLGGREYEGTAWPLLRTHAQQRPGEHSGAGTKPGQRDPDGAGAPGEDSSTEPRRCRKARSGSWLPVLRAEGDRSARRGTEIGVGGGGGCEGWRGQGTEAFPARTSCAAHCASIPL